MNKHRVGACGRGGCAGELSWETNGAGVAFARCSGCERLSRGICQDCPVRVTQPKTGRRRWRCEPCATKRNHEIQVPYMREYFVGYKKRPESHAYRKAYWKRPDVLARARQRYQNQKLAILRRERRVA